MIEQPMERPRHWLEYVSMIVALFVSIVSLWVAVRTEQANSRMVDANYKMVAAASWPFLQIKSGNSADGVHSNSITLDVENAGVGPAKIKTFEVFWKGQAFPSSWSLMHACCVHDAQSPVSIMSGPPAGVLRAGESLKFLRYDLTPDNGPAWKTFDRVRFSELTYRACYCSVFDECRLSDLRGRETAVKACPKPPIPYVE